MDTSLLERDISVDAFLAHHGVRGMHWGYRNSKAKKGDWRTRSGGQKVGLVAGGVVGNTIGASVGSTAGRFVGGILGKVGGAPVAGIAQLAGGLAGNVIGAKYGVRLARNFQDRYKSTKVSEIRRK